MTTSQKIKMIQQLSGLTQQELAGRIGVTFAALNRWINGNVQPRAAALAKLDELYLELTGQKVVPESVLIAKKEAVMAQKRKHARVLRNISENPDIRDRFLLSLTYNSNKIEGSSLSEGDTADIMFRGMALPNKSLIEQLEVKNHQAALEYLFTHLSNGGQVNEELVLKMHAILLNAIRDDAGIYRYHGVRITGSNVPTANYLKVPELMARLAHVIKNAPSDVIAHIAGVHGTFEQIHPFSDGNGRTGRLLMHAMALSENLPPVVVLQEKKKLYLACLNKAQTTEDVSLLEDFICDAILEGYKIIDRNE